MITGIVMGGTHSTMVYRDTKFSRYQYRRGHVLYSTIYKRDTINEPFTVKSFLILRACKDLLLKLSSVHHYKIVTECMAATSVACERIFSTSGSIVNARRNRLTAENVDMLTFGGKNLHA